MVTGNSETSEVFISPSSLKVKDKAEKRKLEHTHTDGPSPSKDRRLGLTKTQKRRRARKLKKQRLAEGAQEVTVTATGDVSVQGLDTSVELEVVPGGKKKRKRRKKKLAAKIKGTLAGECPQGETSPDQSVTLDVKVSAKKRWKSESSLAESRPTEDVKSPAKKRKMKENESECSQVEMSLEKSVESQKKRRKRHKKKKAMVTGNNETPELFISANCVSNSDKAEMIKHELTHTENGASTPKERHFGPTGLTKTQKRRRCRIRARKRNKQKLAEAAQEVTVTASEKAPGVAQEKPPQNQIATETQSSPTFADKLPSKKSKRHRKKKKIGIASEKPDGDGPVQTVDTSVDPEVVPEEKKKRRRRRKKKLANGSVAEMTGDSVPQRVWESGDVRQSARSEKSEVSTESKQQVKAAKLKGKLAGKRVILKRSIADKRLNKLKKTIVSIARSQSECLLQLTRRCLCVQ